MGTPVIARWNPKYRAWAVVDAGAAAADIAVIFSSGICDKLDAWLQTRPAKASGRRRTGTSSG
jgi:hypothetical protein